MIPLPSPLVLFLDTPCLLSYTSQAQRQRLPLLWTYTPALAGRKALPPLVRSVHALFVLPYLLWDPHFQSPRLYQLYKGPNERENRLSEPSKQEIFTHASKTQRAIVVKRAKLICTLEEIRYPLTTLPHNDKILFIKTSMDVRSHGHIIAYIV